MLFSIITPTYKRPDKLVRAVASVQAQTYSDWEMIIVNDSPNDTGYQEFASSINDARISYHVNPTNKGVNFTRNRGLDKVSADSKWVIFLDDDDWLSPDALKTFHDLILIHGDVHWFVTNRAYKNGTPITKAPASDTTYSYTRDYLLLRRIKGDATHIISTQSIHLVRFSKHVKQGEEWLFFYQLGLSEKMFYHNHNSTITDGYDNEKGLNFRKRSFSERFETVMVLFYEGLQRGFGYRPTFLTYLIVRFMRILFK